MKDVREDGYPDDEAFNKAAEKRLRELEEDETKGNNFLQALERALRK